MSGDITRQQGNWSQLRTLVLKLLQAHEDAIDDHDDKLTAGVKIDAELKKDIDRCLEEIFGDASTDSLRTAIRLVQAEQAGMRKEVDGAHAKANAAHAKANENAKSLAQMKGEKKDPPSTRLIASLVGIITVLVNGLFELVKHLAGSGGN